MNAELVDSYRSAREAQLQRFEAEFPVIGRDETSEEYRRWFGLGEYSGCEVERPVMIADWMRQQTPSLEVLPHVESIGADVAFRLPGRQLAALASEGDIDAQAEIQRRAVRRATKRAAKVAA